jgi:hypothetical protein
MTDAIEVSTSTQVALRLVESVVRLSDIGLQSGHGFSLSDRSDTERGSKFADEFRTARGVTTM